MWQPFDRGMWDGFAGAERFADGQDPWFAEVRVDGREGIAIADATGVCVDLDNGQDYPEIWALDHPNSRWVVAGWSKDLRLSDMVALGFRRVS